MGAIDTAETLALIQKEFVHIPKSSQSFPQPHLVEPKQEGERRFTISRESTKSLVGLAHKVPAGLDADFPALLVLFQILSGGPSSRLHRALVDKALASEVGDLCMPFHDPFIAGLYATPAKGVKPQKIEAVLLRQIERIKNNLTQSEVRHAIASLVAEYQFDKDGLGSIGHALSEAIAIGDWTWYPRYPAMIQKVTVASVKRAARKYLIKESRTSGTFIGLPPQGGRQS